MSIMNHPALEIKEWKYLNSFVGHQRIAVCACGLASYMHASSFLHTAVPYHNHRSSCLPGPNGSANTFYSSSCLILQSISPKPSKERKEKRKKHDSERTKKKGEREPTKDEEEKVLRRGIL